jgi:hypothetical protein
MLRGTEGVVGLVTDHIGDSNGISGVSPIRRRLGDTARGLEPTGGADQVCGGWN